MSVANRILATVLGGYCDLGKHRERRFKKFPSSGQAPYNNRGPSNMLALCNQVLHGAHVGMFGRIECVQCTAGTQFFGALGHTLLPPDPPPQTHTSGRLPAHARAYAWTNTHTRAYVLSAGETGGVFFSTRPIIIIFLNRRGWSWRTATGNHWELQHVSFETKAEVAGCWITWVVRLSPGY